MGIYRTIKDSLNQNYNALINRLVFLYLDIRNSFHTRMLNIEYIFDLLSIKKTFCIN